MNDMIRHKLMTFLFSFGPLPVLCERVVVFDLKVKCCQLNLLRNTDFFFDKVGLFSDIVINENVPCNLLRNNLLEHGFV